MAADASAAASAVDLRDRLASGALRAEELVETCIARIEAREPEIGAWAWFDADHARDQARRLDEHRRGGRPIGSLHGLPVGLKDIVDTTRIPTENGCALDAGRMPQRDAFVVDRLKAAGALILGKTVTAELAYLRPGQTRNPRNPAHTPGGSSSGSAAAVADGMAPLAVGTQTGGSVVRPAAYCGVVGFKPTFGAIPRSGILRQSQTLDTVGVFAIDPEGVALIADALFGHDAGDKATAPAPAPQLLSAARSEPPLAPVLALVHPPGWNDADEELKAAFGELQEALGEQVFEVELPKIFSEAESQRRIINFAEMAKNYYRYWRDGADQLGEETREAIEKGNAVAARDYVAALDWPDLLNAALEEIFERCDAIVCPSALGAAPEGLDSTGSLIFNGLWTLCGTPAINLPLLTSSKGLPMGVQLVGPRHGDGRLFRTARWLFERMGG